VRLALIGDVHLSFDAHDAAALDADRYDAVLFAGDLSGYSPRGGLRVGRYIASLRTPTLVVPGNHDGALPHQLLAEMMRHEASIELTASGQAERVAQLRAALAPAVLGGYSVHPLRAAAGSGRDERIDCVVGRPHSFGGPQLSFRPYLREQFGIDSIERSAERLCALVDATTTERIVFLAHNGPSGLGEKKSDIWGADFRKSEGDFGDPDLRTAIVHARRRGKRVLAVLAGHMHHAVRGGGERTWTVKEHETLFVNAARVPRVWKAEGKILRHHVEVVIEGERVEARAVVREVPPRPA
jgi:uncharacterized protein (TIGR04168 family)